MGYAMQLSQNLVTAQYCFCEAREKSFFSQFGTSVEQKCYSVCICLTIPSRKTLGDVDVPRRQYNRSATAGAISKNRRKLLFFANLICRSQNKVGWKLL